MQEKRKAANILIYSILTILSVIFIIPIALVIMNSLKNKLYISTSPFALPDSESFRGLKNYIEGLTKIHFMDSIGYSLFITVVSVIMIIVFCSMTAWYITRVKNKLTHTSHTKIRHTTINYAALGIWKRFFQFSGSLLIKRDTSSAIWHSDAL